MRINTFKLEFEKFGHFQFGNNHSNVVINNIQNGNKKFQNKNKPI